MVQIRLFGGVSAATDAGAPLYVGPAKCQTVLAALALSASSAVSVSRLVDVVWGEEPPRNGQKALQWYVSRLRKALGSEVIVRAGAAYRLDVDDDAVDVARFRQRLEAGDLTGALAEWTGTPLAGLRAPGLTAAVDGLVEQWLGATEVHLAHRIETNPQAAIGPLTELTADHPFREGLWALLMTALYGVGRQADALAAFQRAREQLVAHLGVEPGPRLRELEALVLGQDRRLSRPEASAGSGTGRPTGTVTFGFCQVEGSTGLWVMHRQKMASAMARLDVVVRAAVDRYGGHVFTAGGESFGVAFHRASDAVAWGTELQTAMRSEPWPGGIELRLRVGLHTGETEERGEGYFGPVVITAAGLAAAGHGDQILVSAATSALLDRSDVRDLGTYRLPGVVTELRVLQLGDGVHPPLRTEDTRRGNLPLQWGRLIGREQDLEAIGGVLASGPVVTLVGPGGIGKTRLAIAAARMSDVDRPDGVWIVDLAEIASSSDVAHAVADSLGATERPGRTLTQSIVAFLQSRAALLILDNCEHVIAGAAELAQTIADGCANVRVLATSRESLGVAGEQLIAVAPLEPAGPGVELFNERALAVSQAFDPHATRDDVEKICRRLDGVPLAIELAAARTRSLTPADLLARLDDRLRMLTSGRRTGPERHRTLRATIQWSYDLLTPPEQALFHRLSIFTGAFDLAAAESVAADTQIDVVDISDLVDGLVGRSMLVVEPGSFGRRFRLLETIRQFAAEHLSKHGDTDTIAERHARWCLDQVTGIHQLLISDAESEGVVRLRELWPNLRAAVDWACARPDHELVDALVRPIVAELVLRGRQEIGDWAERILAITPPDDTDLIAFWLTWAAERYAQRASQEAYERLVQRHGEPDHPLVRYTRAYLYGHAEALRECIPEVLTHLRSQGEAHVAGLMELNTAGTLLGTGHFEEVDAFVTALAERYRTHGPPTLLNWTLATLGYSAMFQGKPDLADQLFDRSANVEVPGGTLSANKTVEARAAFWRGQRSRAFQILRSYIDDLLEADNVIAASVVGIEFINMMVAIDRLPEAAPVLGYLQATNEFGALASRTLVADAASRITSSRHAPDLAGHLDDRQALTHMRDVLNELV